MMRTDDYPVVEAAMVEAPDFQLAALERANDAVVIVDGDLHVSYFNAAAELIWGLDRAEVLGRHVSRLGLGDLQQHPVATPAAGRINREDAIRKRGWTISEPAIRASAGWRICPFAN